MLVDGIGGIAGHNCGADLLGLERADPCLSGANLGTLFVCQRGHVHSAGNVIERELGARASYPGRAAFYNLA